MLSYITTCITWDGGFPAGEIRIDVRGAGGQAIKGATLQVYRGGTRELADGYPIANYAAEHGLVSDESGRIVAVQERTGLQFGGEAWKLFWIIPMGQHSGPRFDCQISAAGYRPAEFEIQRLFESPHTMYDEFPKTRRMINGKEVELPVYEQTFTLER